MENEDEDLWEKTNPDTVKVEEHYRGLKIKLPMKAETIVKLTDFFKSRRVCMHYFFLIYKCYFH